MSTLPSPHIFGPQTPSRSESEQDDSYFNFKEIPPPLPPLDHPAFKKGPPSSFKFPLAKYNFPALPDGEGSDSDYGAVQSTRQTTHSLPSMKGFRSKMSVHSSTKSLSRSNGGLESYSEAKSYIHSRKQSKSSIASSSRRSSAEYSAKQASSIGEDIHRMRDGCWEVEVSKAMVCLALGKEEQRVETRMGSSKTRQGASPSSFGKARGKNVCTSPLSVKLSPPHARYLSFHLLVSLFFLAGEWR
ncbi:hypothetical protein BDN70DRAFT_317535 [Pholiota conissans]|uniref:Uncharacterized protein n=1 Tax=Pholiota conissans TaxID=109636 RepID=A0A9P5Z9H7_9AGAR|nr:hypothetical protein BDN70DRAFT_317535 [Pholiota conissans]